MEDENPYVVFGKALDKRMRQKGVRVTDLATALDVSDNTVVNWRKGRFKPEDKYLRGIAIELETDYNELVSWLSGEQSPLDLLAENLAAQGKPQVKKLLQQITIAGLKLSMPQLDYTDTTPSKISKLEEALTDILTIANKLS